MPQVRLIEQDAKDLTEDLARTLPRWVSWIPIVGKASYGRWLRFRAARQAENWLQIELLSARIQLAVRDEGEVQLEFQATNFGPRPLEIDRVELTSMQVGSHQLRRRGEMFAMTYAIPAMGTCRTTLLVDLTGGDLRQVVRGVSRASNTFSSPNVSVSLYGSFHCLDRHRRFRKMLGHTTTGLVLSTMSEQVAEALLKSDGVHE